MLTFTVIDDESAKRLDVFLVPHLQTLSRSSIHKLCERGRVTVNGTIEKPKYKLSAGDSVSVDYDEKSSTLIPKIELPIIFEDEDCLVINKPAGLLTHSKGAFNPEATVATFIEPFLLDMDGDRAGIAHRLDRATSGVIICAKNMTSLAWLQKQFSQRKVKKTYYAIVSGHVEPKHAVIEMPIERHPRVPKTFRVGTQGKPAKTEYEVLERTDKYDYVKLSPTTGRTHQLRVHMKQLGHPIVGDPLYGGSSANRMYLHAGLLELTLPSRERKVFTVPVPVEFKQFIDKNE